MLHFLSGGLKMSETRAFYYNFNPLNGWLILNSVLTIILVYALFSCPCLLYWWQSWVLVGTVLVSTILWGYKYLLRHRMALIDDKAITIDHCAPLKWKDIKYAEERVVRCWLLRYKIIALVPKDNIDYKYNFLQRHNGDFGAFSIPLYKVISSDDAKEISEIIADKTKLKRISE